MDNTTVYDELYYEVSCGDSPYGSDEYIKFFCDVAEHIINDINPENFLDFGCAQGLLVTALRDRGVKAYGVDISQYALNKVREDIKPYCTLPNEKLLSDKKYDLITCIEVLEHLEMNQIKQTIKNFTQLSDDIIISSTPFDYKEETHINIHPLDFWVGEFFLHGFYRDLDYDCSYISTQAVRFKKAYHLDVYSLIRGYERCYFEKYIENKIIRNASLENKQKFLQAKREIKNMKEYYLNYESTKRELPSPLIINGNSLKYSFQCKYDNLCKIDFPIGLYGRKLSIEVILQIKLNGSNDILREEYISLEGIEDNSIYEWYFDPIINSSEKKYDFLFINNTNDGVSLLVSKSTHHKIFINDDSFNNNLCISIYSNKTESISDYDKKLLDKDEEISNIKQLHQKENEILNGEIEALHVQIENQLNQIQELETQVKSNNIQMDKQILIIQEKLDLLENNKQHLEKQNTEISKQKLTIESFQQQIELLQIELEVSNEKNKILEGLLYEIKNLSLLKTIKWILNGKR